MLTGAEPAAAPAQRERGWPLQQWAELIRWVARAAADHLTAAIEAGALGAGPAPPGDGRLMGARSIPPYNSSVCTFKRALTQMAYAGPVCRFLQPL